MVDEKKQVTTADRLARHLGLLQAGSTITLDILTPAGQKARYRTTFIGYLPQNYVLIQYPDSNKVGSFAVHIKQGVKTAVRGIIEGHEGAVVAFASKIKQTVLHPIKLLVLEFPNEVGLQSLRHFTRIDTEIKAAIVFNKKKWRVLITDLSISGCQLYIERGEKLALSHEINCPLLIEDYLELGSLELSVSICNIKQLPNAVSIGVSFADKDCKKVKKLLLTTMGDEG
ncbi:MAG: flagellar brake protein [Alteromonadaceae bacterium]|nr:flagellar brake protein [Alteromonadaceae bacterium]